MPDSIQNADQNFPDSAKKTNVKAAYLLERKVFRSRLAIFIERLWPCVWPPVGVAGLFLFVSLTGFWSALPLWAHQLLLALSGFGFIASFYPLIALRWPERREALQRLDRVSGLDHNPAVSYEDHLTVKTPSRTTQKLWEAHKRRLEKTFRHLKSGWPRPRVDKYDPYGFRAVLAIVLLITILATGDLTGQRFWAAFDLASKKGDAPTIRLDAWITPPAYTGKAPIVLNDGSQTVSEDEQIRRIIKAPVNSELVIRMSGNTGGVYRVVKSEDVTYGVPAKNSHTPVKADVSEDNSGQGVQYTVKLEKTVSIRVQDGGHSRYAWQIYAESDLPPSIRLIKPLAQTAKGVIKLNYQLSDDYGIASAKAFIRRPKGRSKQSRGHADPDAPLGEAPDFELTIPPDTQDSAKGRTYKDLTAHPWAGERVILTLSAKDEAGQESKTVPVQVILPTRKFTKPLAKAIIEQRRRLANKPYTNFLGVMRSLNALTIAPEKYVKDLKAYLSLRSAFWRMQHDPSRKTAQSVVDQLWSVALYIEDGDLSETERQMKLAQEKLLQRLKEGASNEEIQQLLQELRTAVARFLNSVAKNAQNSQGQQLQHELGNKDILTAQDLDRMLKDIEALAKSGSREMASRMINQLRDMLENLSSATAQQNNASAQMMELMKNLGDLVNNQQKLLDQTFQENQKELSRRGEDISEEGKKQSGNLSQRQQKLEEKLRELMKSMRMMGGQPNEQFNQAQEAMKDATRSLGENKMGQAVQQQTLALDKLRKGARQSARNMMRQLGMQIGRSQPRDPFGRRYGSSGSPFHGTTNVPENIDVQRAREILNELRRRYGDSQRPPVELDYLERLLQRF